jgi:hypothetical protein
MPIAPEDFIAISDHMGRYCWKVDEGDEDGWAALWTEDGVFTGVFPEPVVGREALKGVPRQEKQTADGRMRHMIANLHCDYQGDRDTVLARYYNLVTTWIDGGRFACMATSQVLLVRDGAGWLVKRNDTVLFRG